MVFNIKKRMKKKHKRMGKTTFLKIPLVQVFFLRRFLNRPEMIQPYYLLVSQLIYVTIVVI